MQETNQPQSGEPRTASDAVASLNTELCSARDEHQRSLAFLKVHSIAIVVTMFILAVVGDGTSFIALILLSGAMTLLQRSIRATARFEALSAISTVLEERDAIRAAQETINRTQS